MFRLQAATLVLFLLALGASVIVGSPRYIFVISALFILGFGVVGFFILPKLNFALPFAAPPAANGDKIIINGMVISAQDFGRQFACTLELAGWDKLARWLLLSGATFYLLLARVPKLESFFDAYPIFSTYIGLLLGMRAILVLVGWYQEQDFLSRASLTWGTPTGGSTYSFIRPETGYHGGASSKLQTSPVFVLFDPTDPDRNVSVESLKFRRLSISRSADRVQDVAQPS